MSIIHLRRALALAALACAAIMALPAAGQAIEWDMTPPPPGYQRRPPPQHRVRPPAPAPYIYDEPDYRDRPYGVRPPARRPHVSEDPGYRERRRCREVSRWVVGPNGPRRVIERRCR